MAKKVEALDSEQDVQSEIAFLASLSATKGKFRGHRIELDDGVWVYSDDGSSVAENWKETPCGHCGLPFTKDGHDGCLGTLPRVMNACCGHGNVAEAYVQNLDSSLVHGVEAIEKIEMLKAKVMTHQSYPQGTTTGGS